MFRFLLVLAIVFAAVSAAPGKMVTTTVGKAPAPAPAPPPPAEAAPAPPARVPADDIFEAALPTIVEACRDEARRFAKGVAFNMTRDKLAVLRMKMTESSFCSGTDVPNYPLMVEELCKTQGLFVACDPRSAVPGTGEYANMNLFDVTIVALNPRVRIEQHPACVCPIPDDTNVEMKSRS
jgi:hypothetical protein